MFCQETSQTVCNAFRKQNEIDVRFTADATYYATQLNAEHSSPFCHGATPDWRHKRALCFGPNGGGGDEELIPAQRDGV